MKRFLIPLIFVLCVHTAVAVSELEGLWRIEQEVSDTDTKLYHVVIHEAEEGEERQIDFYWDGWVHGTPREIKLEGNELNISLDQSGAVLRLSIDFDSSPVVGSAKFFHPQSRLESILKCRRIVEAGDWAPVSTLESVQKASGVFDLMGFVGENFDGSSFAEFTSFWEEEVTPRFYPLLYFSIYSVEEGLNEDALVPVFEKLDSYQELAERVIDEYNFVTSKLDEVAPDVRINNAVVFLPSFPGIKNQMVRLSEMLFDYRLLDTYRGMGDKALQVSLARTVLETSALQFLPTGGALYQHLHKHIAIVRSLRAMGLSDDDYVLLGMEPEMMRFPLASKSQLANTAGAGFPQSVTTMPAFWVSSAGPCK